MATKILFLVVAIAAFATAINGRTLPVEKNAADLHTAFYHFHFPRYGGPFGGFRGGAGTGFGGVGGGRSRGGGFVGSGGGSSFDGGAGTGSNGSLKSGGESGVGGGSVDDGVEGGLVP